MLVLCLNVGCNKSHRTGLYQLDLRVSWKRKGTEGGQERRLGCAKDEDGEF